MSETGKKVAEATRLRAAAYAHLFRVLRKDLGEDRAAALMGEAIRALGKEKAAKHYSAAALAGDLAAAAREFAAPDEVKQHQFAPRVVDLSDGEAVIAMSRCPLVDQWREMGHSPEDVEALCRIAREVDFGTWEGALGFSLAFEGTRAEGKERCVLRVRKIQRGE